MTPKAWWRRFLVRGVFWRQFLRWAVLNIPFYVEPIVMAWWSLFFLLWGPGRHGVMTNLKAIFPRSSALGNLLRTYRVFWNFAWTITDNARFNESKTVPDWEFEGLDPLERLHAHQSGAIILTAHMGSYDLGAQLFSLRRGRSITMVRAPEPDPDTHRFEEAATQRTAVDTLRVDFNTRSGDLALHLVDALQRGELVAIQGDRVTPGIASSETTLFGQRMMVPTGPFALALATHTPIYPLFIIRTGRRRYRVVVYEPICVTRGSRDHPKDFSAPIGVWTSLLEEMVRRHWYQWYTFEAFAAQEAV